MNQKTITRSVVRALFVVGVLFVAGNPVFAAEPGPSAAARATSDIPGSYLALMDVTALGFGPRIETLAVLLDSGGRALLVSEHEADKESAGVGVWGHVRGGKIGVGLLSFHIGPEPTSSLCSLVGATSPPDNCILKVGGVLSRSGGGSLAGEILLTIESVDGAHAVTFPHPLPLTAERMSLEDFPGALPQ